MPSFRVRLPIGDLLPGHAPEEVMETAEAVLGSIYRVEAKDLEVVARIPRIVLRFTVPESSWDAERAAAVTAAGQMRRRPAGRADRSPRCVAPGPGTLGAGTLTTAGHGDTAMTKSATSAANRAGSSIRGTCPTPG